ncbi:MAG: hypothetical protein A2161_13465 [Candidatus Schekmanbacteria bacterium RBG_13_48_7]|uniref:Chromosomal replication initiator protein DnaA n=1 Tax=Candidatus Schekmanbacteria bacterium RBG_13_48_7 TaxID=1817878 RepID=A0A1F7S9N5_9BACT|nr:MAG: hypothetical protein A2161_13465 [Candidatus Schekmanbacteria bacterium RBG_13_48_7]
MNTLNEEKKVDDLWNLILQDIQQRVNKQSFETWFKPIKLSEITEDTLVIEVPSEDFGSWLKDHYLAIIQDIATTYINYRPAILFTANGNGGSFKKEKTGIIHEEEIKADVLQNHPVLNSKYTFESFVVGSCNQFAHAASEAVAKRPGELYNPLFIYGGVGLGKTHLMHAIGHSILSRKSMQSLMYLSSENFMNDVIHSIRHDKMNEFRDRYNKVKVLLIDDIQFIAGKERTQEVFFHIFNSLYESQKQIVISSDLYPKDMVNIEKRIRSRFEWGLIADIQPPDLETKIAILMKKAEIEKIHINSDVAMFIAERNRSNVRELEGALIRVGAFASLTGKKITVDFAEEVLRGIMDDPGKVITIELIQKLVAKYFNIKLNDMLSKTRAREFSYPRQIAMYLCREILECSLPEIGKKFGGKDHATVIYSHKKVKKEMEKDPNLRKTLQILDQQIKS